MYGNPDGDWVGDIAGHLGLNGNFSEDAQFCDAEDHIFTLAVNSPCAADNNDCGELIGARPVDCESVDTETTLHVPAEYATLALAIDASVDGDTILIECGNYQVDNLQVFSKEIVIRSESSTPECVTLFAGNSGRILTGHGVAGGFRMEGLTLQSADFAALYFYAGAPRIRNCVFQNNNQSIVDYESFTRINNCTFWNNHGPCVSAYSAGFPSVHGSIFWGNHGDLFFESWGGISVSCSDVEGGWPGTGNFDLNPLFCNPNGNLFRLHPESPCSPDNNDCGILIGACSVGCAVSTRSLNWGDLKSLY
ncbi:hypothetical protein H8E52_10585 [bacterium]|nr:hypothetical protein [bacterium]